MQAANAQIGVAISAYYPSVSLFGGGGFESLQITTLIQGPGGAVVPGRFCIAIALRRWTPQSLTQQSRDLYEATAADYRQSVLTSFQEVEDSLAAVRILNEESRSENSAVAYAEHSLNIATNRYKGGVTGYLEVLTAQTAQLNNQRSAADISTRQFVASVRLVRAIGGGWDASQFPSF